jgi:hypothetical protein
MVTGTECRPVVKISHGDVRTDQENGDHDHVVEVETDGPALDLTEEGHRLDHVVLMVREVVVESGEGEEGVGVLAAVVAVQVPKVMEDIERGFAEDFHSVALGLPANFSF